MPERLKQLVEQGSLGRKSGRGFYTYQKGKPVRTRNPQGYQAAEDIQDRLLLRMLNESMACLREAVVEDADLLDAGMIFGTGFAPFRGGPMQYLHTEQAQQLKARLQALQQSYGARFAPDPQWDRV